MKHLYYFIWAILLLPQNFMAQQANNSELNAPRTGDVIIKREIPWIRPEKGGKDLTWDLSHTESAAGHSLSFYSLDDGYIRGLKNGMVYTFRIGSDSLLLTGEENSASITRYQEPLLLMKFPLASDSRCQGLFFGKGKYCDRLALSPAGWVETQADATGKLILSEGDTLDNVIRLHIQRKELSKAVPIDPDFNMDSIMPQPDPNSLLVALEGDSTRFETDRYLWYAQGYRYPVLETHEKRLVREGKSTVLEQLSFLCLPADQAVDDPDNEQLRKTIPTLRSSTDIENAVQNKGLHISPNPIGDRFEVTASLSASASVEICVFDLNGKIIYQTTSPSGSGEFSSSIDSSQWPRGAYIVRINSGNKILSEKIVKL